MPSMMVSPFVELTHDGTLVAVNVERIGWFLADAGTSGAIVRVAGIDGALDVEESYAEICAKLAALLPDSHPGDARLSTYEGPRHHGTRAHPGTDR